MTKNTVNKSYLTPNEVAELLMVSPATIRQWTEKNALKALTTPGGHRRFLPEEVNNFARQIGLTLNTSQKESLRMLIVDDDSSLIRHLREIFQETTNNIEIEVVSDGFSAGVICRDFAPQYILLDLKAPGIVFTEFCKRLKIENNLNSAQIIAMTAYPSEFNFEKIKNAGADVCLTKPIDKSILIQELGLS